MSFIVGEIVAVVKADTSRFKRDMATVRREGADSSQKVQKGFDGIAAKARMLGPIIAAGMTAPIVMGAKQAVQEFALLEGAMAKFNVVFGEQSEEMKQWVDQFRENVPLATREIVQHAGALQDLMVPMGIARSEATDMTKEWLKLAAALAAFNDVPVDEALSAIRGGIAGETEALRRFGVDARVAAIEQRALSMGLIQAGEKMTEQVRQQALLAQAYANSSDAVNGYQDQLGSTLMKEQEVQATFKDTLALIGEDLQPTYNEMLTVLKELLDVYKMLHEPMRTFLSLLGDINDVAGNVTGLGKITGWIKSLWKEMVTAKNFTKNMERELLAFLDATNKEPGEVVKEEDVETVKEMVTVLSELKPKIDNIRPIDAIFDPTTVIEPMEELYSIVERMSQLDVDLSHRLAPAGSIQGIRDQMELLQEQINLATDPERIAVLREEYEGLKGQMQEMTEIGLPEEIQQMSDASKEFAQTFGSLMTTAIFQTSRLKEEVKGLIKQLAKRAFITGLSFLLPGGPAIGSTSFFGAMFGGFRAGGGGVNAGRSYVVGEKGPELFMPSSNGNIVSNSQMNQGSQISPAMLESAVSNGLRNVIRGMSPDELYAFTQKGKRGY